MEYFKSKTNEVYGYDPLTQQELIAEAIANDWENVTESWPPLQEVVKPLPPTKEQLLVELQILTAKIEALA